MAGIPIILAIGSITAAAVGTYAFGAAGKLEGGDIIYLPDGKKIQPGTTVKLKPDAASKYPSSGLTSPGSNFTGRVEFINRDVNPVTIEVSNMVRNRRFQATYAPADFIVLFPPDSSPNAESLKIHRGLASVGTRVKFRKIPGAENSSPKALESPAYNPIGVVESIDKTKKIINVKAVSIKDPKITYTQYYLPDELVFVSLPYGNEALGVATAEGYVNVGTRVSMKLAKKLEKESTELFLTSKEFEPVGVVTALHVENNGKNAATVKCKHRDSTNYYDQKYLLEDLQPVGMDGVPVGGVFILGGLAEDGVKVKLREEKKNDSPGKCLSRPTYGFSGTVEDTDLNAGDNLKVQVRCVGSKEGEEATDWYEPEHLEVMDMPKDNGVPIFGGFANVGDMVEVMIDARGAKCLGKPDVGNVGIVMGIDPNAAEGETLNIKCGRDIKSGSKVTNWYKPTDVKVYVKIDMTGSPIERKEIELMNKRAELVKVQRESATGESAKLLKKENIDRISNEIKVLEKELEELKTKGSTLEGMRELYSRLMEELVAFRKNTAAIDTEYNTAKLDTSCNTTSTPIETQLREESEGIIDRYYSITNPASVNAVLNPPAGTLPLIQDGPSDDPATLKNLRDEAESAVEAYNTATEANKAAAKTAATTAAKTLRDYEKTRQGQLQNPLTDLQKTYIASRDKFLAALGPNANLIVRLNFMDRIDANIPGMGGAPAAANSISSVVPPGNKYTEYLKLVEAVERAKLTNPEDPIAHVAQISAGGTIIYGAEVLNTFVIDDPNDPNDLGNVAINIALNIRGVAVPVPAPAQLTALQQAGEFLRSASEALIDELVLVPPNAAKIAELKAKCKLAAYELLVAAVDTSLGQTTGDRFLTKLYWEKRFKDESNRNYEGDFKRKFDIMDVVQNKLNKARNNFTLSLGDRASPLKNIQTAFENFEKARAMMSDEVHGETTLLERQIIRLTVDKKSQSVKVLELNNEMTNAQNEYIQAVTREKQAEIYMQNAFARHAEEIRPYLTIAAAQQSKPKDSTPRGSQRPPRGAQAAQGATTKGGAIGSKGQEVLEYLARMYTNHLRFAHYRRVILDAETLPISPKVLTMSIDDIKAAIIPMLSRTSPAAAVADPPITRSRSASSASSASSKSSIRSRSPSPPPSGDKVKFIGRDDFFEPQYSQGCGRHALNNLLGGKVFSKTDKSVIINDTTIQNFNLNEAKPFPLNDFCEYLNTKPGLREPCLDSEFYTELVLTGALTMAGYSVDRVNKSNPGEKVSFHPELVGFIGNDGGAHYVAFKKISGRDTFRKVDSQVPASITSAELTIDQVFGDKHSVFLSKVTWIGKYSLDIPSTAAEIAANQFQNLKNQADEFVAKTFFAAYANRDKLLDKLFIILHNAPGPDDLNTLLAILKIPSNMNAINTCLTKDNFLLDIEQFTDATRKYGNPIFNIVFNKLTSCLKPFAPPPPPTGGLDDGKGNIEEVIAHQDRRFAELTNILRKYTRIEVIIAGDPNTKKHELGTYLAKGWWGAHPDGNANYIRMLSNIDKNVNQLVKDFPSRIAFNMVGIKSNSKKDRRTGEDTCQTNQNLQPKAVLIHVWGANPSNYNVKPLGNIIGDGQAACFSLQQPGIFGVVTTSADDVAAVNNLRAASNYEVFNTNYKKGDKVECTHPNPKIIIPQFTINDFDLNLENRVILKGVDDTGKLQEIVEGYCKIVKPSDPADDDDPAKAAAALAAAKAAPLPAAKKKADDDAAAKAAADAAAAEKARRERDAKILADRKAEAIARAEADRKAAEEAAKKKAQEEEAAKFNLACKKVTDFFATDKNPTEIKYLQFLDRTRDLTVKQIQQCMLYNDITIPDITQQLSKAGLETRQQAEDREEARRLAAKNDRDERLQRSLASRRPGFDRGLFSAGSRTTRRHPLSVSSRRKTRRTAGY